MNQKRIKHICVNLKENEYNQLNNIALLQRRRISDAAYLIIIDNLKRYEEDIKK